MSLSSRPLPFALALLASACGGMSTGEPIVPKDSGADMSVKPPGDSGAGEASGSSEGGGTPGEAGSGGTVGAGEVACSTAAGVVPAPNCYFGSGVTCVSKSPACPAGSDTACGNPLCRPMADNSKSTTKNFRMESLYIASPPALSNNFLQGSVITSAVTLNDAPQCGYGVTTGLSGPGNGLFNWLLSIDTATSTITIGGAPFSADPYKDGYCFADSTIKFGGGGSVTLAPLADQPITLTGDSFSVGPLNSTLIMPIFTTAAPGSIPILLPIDGLRLEGTMSADGNCIGDINPEWYATAGAGSGSSGCQDRQAGVPSPSNTPTCPKWFTNGALGGHMTLANADNVCVAALMTSLCTVLTGSTGVPCSVCGGKDTCCSPAAGDFAKGDYCSKTHRAGGCNDSSWISATFAANAVSIHPAGSAPCQ